MRRNDAGAEIRDAAMTGNAGRQGFTLLELLIAMTLLGLVMVMLFGGLRLGTRIWETAEARSEQTSRLEVVQGFLRRILQGAQPLTRRNGSAQQLIAFVGRRDTVEFVALMPPHLSQGGFHHVVLSVADGPEDRRLTVRQGPLRHDTADGTVLAGAEEAEEKPLLDRVSRVEFSYFGALERDAEPGWRNEWVEAISLPQLIRVRVRFAGGDRRVWPDLFIAPRLGSADSARVRRRDFPGRRE